MNRGGPPSNEALASLRQEISELRSRLASRTSDGLSTPDTPDLSSPTFSEDAAAIIEWRSKYDRLYESYRRLQKTNAGLEDKLLRVVDKFEGEKNQITRDLAAQTQKLVEAKMTIQRLSDQNRDLQSDLNLSINLLRNKPNSFVSPKIDSLPPEVRSRVKTYIEGGSSSSGNGQTRTKPDSSSRHTPRNEGKKIRVAIPDDLPLLGENSGENSETIASDRVSAAILAKVLEERDKERRAEAKFCIDVGTQTHGWHLNPSNVSSNNNSSSNSPQGTSSLSSSASASPPFSNGSRRSMIYPASSVASNILLASVIHPAPPSLTSPQSVQEPPQPPQQPQPVNNEFRMRPSLTSHNLTHYASTSILQRSATFSAMQTDL